MGSRSGADEAFDRFVNRVEPRLRAALVALRGPEDGRDAVAEALMYAWEHWAEVELMQNPAGFLYRVGQSKSRRRRRALVPVRTGSDGTSRFEPGLDPALAKLSEAQRTAVVLVHGFEWTYQEVADALAVSRSSVGTHVSRGMARLRDELEVVQGA
jgi:RNA polymerase sigma-70 factor (ECF subfamily)